MLEAVLIVMLIFIALILHVLHKVNHLYAVLCIISKALLNCDIKDLFIAENNYNLKRVCKALNKLLAHDLVDDIAKLKIKKVKDEC